MNENFDYSKCISKEQYEALATELLPSMAEFFKSPKGQKLFEEFMINKTAGSNKAA